MKFSDEDLGKLNPEFLHMTPDQQFKVRALLAKDLSGGGMMLFGILAPETAADETRTLIVSGDSTVADGEYAFLEMYCSEYGCDCRRVVIRVIEASQPNKVCATFNYGWESKAFYRRWTGDIKMADEMAGAVIEPFGENGPLSEGLFELFKSLMLTDAAYVDRLKRHYDLFRSLLDEGASSGKRRWRPPGRTGGGRRKR